MDFEEVPIYRLPRPDDGDPLAFCLAPDDFFFAFLFRAFPPFSCMAPADKRQPFLALPTFFGSALFGVFFKP